MAGKRIDINNCSVFRSDGSGNRDPNGTTLTVYIEAEAVGTGASIASISASADSATLALTNNDYTIWTGHTFATSSEYEVTVTAVSDDGTYDETVTLEVPKGTATSGRKLGEIGLMALWDKIKNLVRTHIHSNASSAEAGFMSSDDKDKLDSIAYGTTSTAASTGTKVVTASGFKLQTGSQIDVKFTVTNTASVGNLKLNVNSTGAIAIKYRGANLPSADTLTAGRVYRFVYDGTNYELVGDLDTAGSVTNLDLGQGYGLCQSAAATVPKVVGMPGYQKVNNGIIAVKFTNAVPASATINVQQTGVSDIYHKGAAIAAGVINAGDTAVFMYDGTNYKLIAVDSWGDEITTAWIDANLV